MNEPTQEIAHSTGPGHERLHETQSSSQTVSPSDLEARQENARLLLARLDDCFSFTPQDWAKFIHDWAEFQGWNDPARSESEWAALAHTEISEAFEEWRQGREMFYAGENGKPEGMAIEYGDLLIRVLHWFAAHDVNPIEAIAVKMEYNISRPFRHGGLRA